MNEQSEPVDPALRLDPEVEVYRLLTRASDMTDGKVQPSAFYLRKNRDGIIENGISVQIAGKCQLDAEVGMKNAPVSGIRAIVSLLVREVKEIRVVPYELDVIACPDVSTSEAIIINVPHKDENLEAAERIADLLANQRSPFWLKSKH